MRQILVCVVAGALVSVSASLSARPVKLINVSATDAALTRQFFGQVVARETVDLAFQVGGQVVQFPAIEGATIPAGGLVAELDLEPFELEVDQARLQKDQADRDFLRFTQLSGAAVSQVQIDNAETDAQLAAVSLRNAEYRLERATLVAPFDALVAVREVANFTTVDAGVPVVRLHDMSEIRIEIDVPEVLFLRAGEDPDVEIFANFPSIDRDFPLETREFNAETSEVGQTFQITLAMEPVAGVPILPGATATVTAILRTGQSEIHVPPAAVAADPDGTLYVMVFEPAGADTGTVRRVDVEVAPATSGPTLAVLSGLSGGEDIVAAGTTALDDGQSVTRFTGFPK
ncbi:MAG: efflux RND transporter periplasmic adaptor subunit [Pseudomonadota bacterium]